MTAKINLTEPYQAVPLPKEAVCVTMARTLDDLV
jgi:hypothetical protein